MHSVLSRWVVEKRTLGSDAGEGEFRSCRAEWRVVDPFWDVSWRRRRPPSRGARPRLAPAPRRYVGVWPGGTGDNGVMMGVSVMGVRGLM